MVLPPIVVAIIWKVIYTPDISPLEPSCERARVRERLGLITHADLGAHRHHHRRHLGVVPVHDADDPGGLQMMPEEYVEAARIDGASAIADDAPRHAALPPGVLLVAALFRLIDSIKAFPLIYILTDGGPGTVTEVTNFYSSSSRPSTSATSATRARSRSSSWPSQSLISWAIVRHGRLGGQWRRGLRAPRGLARRWRGAALALACLVVLSCSRSLWLLLMSFKTDQDIFAFRR